MYFSKNSGYVLWKAKCLSNASFFACLKGTHRTLGIKSPIDDPSKPPLRLNVPNDSTQQFDDQIQDSSKFVQKDFQESSPRNLLSIPNSLNAEGDGNVLTKNENETQLSKFPDDIIQNVHNLEYSASTTADEQTVGFKDEVQLNFQNKTQVSNQYDIQKSDCDPNEGLVTLFDENYYYDSNINKNLETGKYTVNCSSKSKISDETKTHKISRQKQKGEDESLNNLYIIIDAPQKQEAEKLDSVNNDAKQSAVVDGRKITSSQTSENNLPTVKTLSETLDPTSKPSKRNIKHIWPKTSLPFDSQPEKSLNFPRNSQQEDKSNVKFEVHELDDASTYVFHLKLKRSLTGKPITVQRVPEKEINTRSHPYENENYDTIRIYSGKGITKELSDLNVDDLADEHRRSEAMSRSRGQGKKDISETLNKIKSARNSEKSVQKIKSKRCLTDCPYQSPPKKEVERSDAKKLIKTRAKSEPQKYYWNYEKLKAEEPYPSDQAQGTTEEVQNSEEVKLPFETDHNKISPLRNPNSLTYRFFQDWNNAYKLNCARYGILNEQPVEEISSLKKNLLTPPEISEEAGSLTLKNKEPSKTPQLLNPNPSKKKAAISKQPVLPGDWGKPVKVEEKKSAAPPGYEFENKQGKKEYLTYPSEKYQAGAYEKKTGIPSPEKRPQEKTEYYILPVSSSPPAKSIRKSKVSKQVEKATQEKPKKKLPPYELPDISFQTEKPFEEAAKEKMELAYLKFANEYKLKKKLKSESRENEKKLDKSEKNELMTSYFADVAKNNDRRGRGENEEINDDKFSPKEGGSSSYIPSVRGGGGDKGRGDRGKPNLKCSGVEENLSSCPKSEPVNFQTSESIVKISSEKLPMKFSAAFPPTLSEVLSNRCKGLGLFKRESLFQQNWSKRINFRIKEFESIRRSLNDIDDFSGNSILFPKMETQFFDFNYQLFESKKDGILNVSKTEKEGEKIADNMANIANEDLTESKGKSSVDSLTMMKKVKEIVDLDLQNAVTIFEGREPEPLKDASSVLTWTDDGWKVDFVELEKYIESRKSKTAAEIKQSACTGENLRENMKESNIILDYDKNSQKIDDNQIMEPKCLPGVKEADTEMKLNSVVEHYPNNNVFKINEDELKHAQNTSTENFEKLYAKAVVLKMQQMIENGNYTGDLGLMSNALTQINQIPPIMEMKNGDSILVFDELTQTWMVDYSILEKRQEQQKQEEELARKSELILETFEKFEKENLPMVDRPMPNTGSQPKIFDYNKSEWKVYEPEKTNNPEKSKKTKQPFKESNAQEIRKKNSDLYENLFAVKKEDPKLNQDRKEAPGVKSPANTKKESLQNTKILAKESNENGTTYHGDFNDVQKYHESDKKKKDQNFGKEDENFWETFIRTNVLPFDRAAASQKEHVKEEVHKKQDIEKKSDISGRKPDPKGQPSSPITTPSPSLLSEKKGSEEKFRLSNILRKSESPKTNSEKENRPSEPKATIQESPPKTPPVSNVKSGNLSEPKSAPSTSETSSTSSKLLTEPLPEAGSSKTETPPAAGKTTKNVSEHYVSENILEMSKSKAKEKNSKPKSSKVETVKLKIIPDKKVSSDKKIPSIITEINLNKKCEEQAKESSVVPKKPSSEELKQVPDKTPKKIDKPSLESKKFYKNFEKYKTPYSDPEYEEKSVKINSDLESNPNLKKLDNWNKTLVLHDVAKPNENIESWLKDESDKMATLLLKVLQEAAEGKHKKKNSQAKTAHGEKNPSSGNPYDNIRKKQETSPESFLFKMRSVGLPVESEKKLGKTTEEGKLKFLPNAKSIPVQSSKTAKQSKIVEVIKISPGKDSYQLSAIGENAVGDVNPKSAELIQEKMDYFYGKELCQTKFLTEWTEEIPGPEILKKMSNTWKLFPIIGCQLTVFTLLRIFQLVNFGNSFLSSMGRDRSRRQIFSKLFAKYGPIVNIQGPLSGNVILIHRPEHLTGVFQQDALISRSVFDSIDMCRRDADARVIQTGISTDWSKPEWSNLKKKTHDPLIKGCEKYLTHLEMAGDGLVNKIKLNKNAQNFVSADFMEDIKKWSMEGFFSVLFERSFGIMQGSKSHVTWLLEPEKLQVAVEEATDFLNKCERGFQVWRIMPTPSSVGLNQAYRSLSEILTKQLYQTEVTLKSKNDLLKSNNLTFPRELTFMESMLLNDGMPIEEIICNLVDMMIIGTNAMSSALGFVLYNLAQNVKVQNKLLKEVMEHLPEKSSRLDYHKLHSLKYLQACLKESLRMNMPFPLFFRLLQNDVILSNYIIPKGSYVVMDSRVSSMREQIFDNPDKFLPERWLNDERWMQANHPFSSFPFCHGPRAELAKRIAEIQLWSCLAKIVRNFEIEYQFGEIQGTENLISFPNKPLKLNFIERLE